MTEELINSIVTEDNTIVCDDDDKLEKTCSKLARIPVDLKQKLTSDLGASTGLYIVATLGEPDKDRPVLN
jgi:hypothetical protein